MYDSILACCSTSYKPITLGAALLSILFHLLCTLQSTSIATTARQLDSSLSLPWLIAVPLWSMQVLLGILGMFVLCLAYKKINYRVHLFIGSAVTLILALLVLLTYPAQVERNQAHLMGRLNQSIGLYDYHLLKPDATNSTLAATTTTTTTTTTAAPPVTAAPGGADGNASEPLTAATATKIWDYMQSQGCCGLRNVSDWKVIPHSCCANFTSNPSNESFCAQADSSHQKPCFEILNEQAPAVRHMLYLIVLLLILELSLSFIQLFEPDKYQAASQSVN